MCIRDSFLLDPPLQSRPLDGDGGEVPERGQEVEVVRGEAPVSYTHLTLPTSDLV